MEAVGWPQPEWRGGNMLHHNVYRSVNTSVANEEAREGGREGLRILAGAALSARDISVGEVVAGQGHPP